MLYINDDLRILKMDELIKIRRDGVSIVLHFKKYYLL